MTSTIDFDFLKPLPTRSRLGWVLLLAGLGLLAWQAVELRTAQRTSADLQNAIESLQSRSRMTQQEQKQEADPTPAERIEISQARAASLQLNYPWDTVFNAIEKAQHPDIALLGVDPKSKTGQIRLTAEAKDSAAMTLYVANLQRSPYLSRALLTSHQIQSQQPGTPLRFQVLAQWKDTTPNIASIQSSGNGALAIPGEKVLP
jgi:Tfp pilus assembly protein PilN